MGGVSSGLDWCVSNNRLTRAGSLDLICSRLKVGGLKPELNVRYMVNH